MLHGLRRQQHLYHAELAVKAHRKRHARQREHAQGHDPGIQRIAAIQSAQVLQGFALEPFARQQHEHAECRQRRQHIADQIEHAGRHDFKHQAVFATHMAGGKHQQHEAVLRNGGIGQHALEVVLHDGRQVAQQQR